MSSSTSSSQRRPKWARQVSAVLVALTQSRLTLRRAAQRSGDRRVAIRLRRLARRRRAAVTELERLTPSPVPETDVPPVAADVFPDEIRTATEIGSLAACLRANRRLRRSIEKALTAGPPPRVARRLESLRDQTDLDAANLNVRLRELITHPIAVGGVGAGSHLPPSIGDQPDRERA